MSSSASRILIAGVGNVLYGDDAFGCEVAWRLAEHSLPGNVRVIDFGIRGSDLVTALLDSYDVVIIVDALSRGDHAGALRVLDSQRNLTIESLPPGFRPQWHSLDPSTALGIARSLGGNPGRVIVVGCEQGGSGEPAVQMGMSESVRAAVNGAADLVLFLVEQLNKGAG